MSLTCTVWGHNWHRFSIGTWCLNCGRKQDTGQLTAPLVIPSAMHQPLQMETPQPKANPAALNQAAHAPGIQTWQPGQIVLEEFLVKKELGKGGMGTVYLLVNTRNGQQFAAKRTHLISESSRQQFLREIQVWVDLPQHPHILPLLFIRTSKNEQVIFTDHMAGGSLQDWLGKPQLSHLEVILDLAVQYAWGLHALHKMGQSHQDVKPGNALLGEYGILKIADFGLMRARHHKSILAQVANDSENATKYTHAGSYTIAYCSPEQYDGKKLTRHTDIWSWGLSVMALFNGTAPTNFGPSARLALYKLVASNVIPKLVADELDRCFEDEPEARWSTLLDATEALIKLHPILCGHTYHRSQPIFIELQNQPKIEHDRQLSNSNAHWTNPNTWLEEAMRADGRDPSDVQRLIDAQASSLEGQAVGDLTLYDEAYHIMDRLVQLGRDDLQERLAILCMDKAFVHEYLNDTDGRIAMYDRAITIYQGLIDKNWNLKPNLADALMNKALVIAHMGQLPYVVTLYDRVITIYEDLLKEGRKDLEVRLALPLMNQAIAFSSMGELDKAIKLYDRVIAIRECLIKTESESDFALVLMNKANAIQYNDCQKQEALELYIKAITIYDRLIKKKPEIEPGLALALMNMANVVSSTGKMPYAVELYDRSINIYQRLVDRGGHRDLERDLAMALVNKSMAVSEMDQLTEAVTLCSQASNIYQHLVERAGRKDLEPEFADVLMNTAIVLNDLGQLTKAITFYDRAIAIHQYLIEKEGRKDLELNLADTLLNKATTVYGMNQRLKALFFIQQAINIYQRLIKKGDQRNLEIPLAKAHRNKEKMIKSTFSWG